MRAVHCDFQAGAKPAQKWRTTERDWQKNGWQKNEGAKVAKK